jgi:endonuclease YncB( thermonuclease family)
LALIALLIIGPLGWTTVSHHGSSGDVAVIDGDTLQIGDSVVQLYGIDAPELGQMCDADGQPHSCGVEAALALRKLISMAGQPLHCKPWHDGETADATGARVEVCEIGSQDVARVLLLGGHGMAPPQSFPDYVEAEKQARQGSLGIWHTTLEPPWEWRDGARLPSERVACNVLGITDAQGRRFYYVPTDPNYNELTLDPARGDVSFCSDEDARSAGWQRPPITEG